MIDELDELRRSNPTTPEAVSQAVAIDRQALMNLLEADSGDVQPQPRIAMERILGGRSGRPRNRVGYVGAIVAAAAAFIGVVFIGGEDPPSDLDAVEVADEVTDDTPATTALTQPASTVPKLKVLVTEPEMGTSTTTEADSPPPAQIPVVDGPFDQSMDLLSLHYDHAHLDDGHAAVAALEIATSFGLQTHVVSGTYANGYDGFVHDVGPVMQAAWGDMWFDAHLDRAGTLSQSIERWLATLDVGGRVWVAEGGVSDFTADVVREVQKQRPNLETKVAIHVVQHNGRNESESTPENLAFLKANTTYERIDDGNDTNGTANLNQRNSEFEAAALAGRHGSSWAAAFEYFPAGQLDFSDTVEVLHIVGVGKDQVADPGDFADRFISSQP